MLGRSQAETGLLMTPWPVAVAFMAPLAGRLADRYAAGILGSGGLAVLALGMLMMAWLPSGPSTFDIVWRMGICGAGFGFFQAPNLRTILASAPPHRSGGASGIIAISRLLGQTLGAALVALCLGLFPERGTVLALGLGAAFAAVAAIASLSRLVVSNKP
jgi:DHA2 family multidrug resistance protein-like MFS transporter